jgi:hypothetical protein
MGDDLIINPDAELARIDHIEDFQFRHIYEAADKVEELVEDDKGIADVVGELCSRHGLVWKIGEVRLTKE